MVHFIICGTIQLKVMAFWKFEIPYVFIEIAEVLLLLVLTFMSICLIVTYDVWAKVRYA